MILQGQPVHEYLRLLTYHQLTHLLTFCYGWRVVSEGGDEWTLRSGAGRVYHTLKNRLFAPSLIDFIRSRENLDGFGLFSESDIEAAFSTELGRMDTVQVYAPHSTAPDSLPRDQIIMGMPTWEKDATRVTLTFKHDKITYVQTHLQVGKARAFMGAMILMALQTAHLNGYAPYGLVKLHAYAPDTDNSYNHPGRLIEQTSKGVWNVELLDGRLFTGVMVMNLMFPHQGNIYDVP